MSVHRLETTQILPLSIGEAWEFFSDPRNLARITPPELGFEITSEVPDRMTPGLIVNYLVRPLLGLPMRWTTEITHVQERVMFVDEQRMGPYRLWHHQHWFTPVPGGVEMRDIVHYALPFGPLGDLLHEAVVGRKVRAIFAYRREVLRARFERAASAERARERPVDASADLVALRA